MVPHYARVFPVVLDLDQYEVDAMFEWRDVVNRLPKPAARWSRLFGLATLVGIAGGLAAAGLHWALHVGSERLVGRFSHFGEAEYYAFHWGVLLLPMIGGLASGVVVHWLCPEAIGHGTNALTRAFHRNLGNFPLKGPLIKAIAAVGVISCGGSAGPEGPVAALGAAIGSTFGRLFNLTPRERRTLLVAGCGAGVGAIFQCPLGGALFAAGILYREPEYESDAIVPAFVSSVVAYSTFMMFPGFGHRLLQGADQLAFSAPRELVPYAILGVLCGGGAILFCLVMRLVEHRLLPWSRLPVWFAPAVGGLATGALACFLPQVMDGQYLFIQRGLDLISNVNAHSDQDWWALARLFGLVALAKCVATAATVGSGASGGVLGPSVFIGGAVGAFVGAATQALFPDTFPAGMSAAMIPVGMGGVLAASMRLPLAAIIMVTEMTGSYGLIVPLMLVCVSAYVVGRRWGLNDEQVRSVAESPAHAGDAIVHMLESWRVGDLMDRDWAVTVSPDATLGQMVERIEPGTRPVFAVAQGNRLMGLISVSDIRQTMEQPGMADVVIAMDMMTERLTAVHPDEDVYQALTALSRDNHDVVPVVSRDRDRHWLGMLSREHVYEAIHKQIAKTREWLLREHAGLAAIESEGQLQQLVMGVAPTNKDMIQRLLVPMQAVGKSLREADFRRQFNAQVVAIEHRDGSVQCPPDIDAPLESGMRLVAIVWQQERGDEGLSPNTSPTDELNPANP
jgi:CIC family chloride channel protein